MSANDDWARLIAMIRTGDPLPQKARDWLANLLELISRGEDPREFLGTQPKRGRPSDARAIVGLHYWLLRAKYGRGGELAARREVAREWRLSDEHVRTIGRKTRSAFRDSASRTEGYDAVIKAIRNEAPGPLPKVVKK
jgi:hypothetical protein